MHDSLNNTPPPPPWPTVSVIAPCRNEVGFIRLAIKSILDNDYPADRIEILVMDGMSTDGTRQIVKEISEQNPCVKLVDNPHRIVPAAMNIGVREATGEFIVRIDCHSRFPADYIGKCIEVSLRTGAANVGGYCQTLAGADTAVARGIMLATSSPFGVGNSTFRVSGGVQKEVDTVPFGTFRKSLFAEVGPYDERLVRNQDIELNSRIRESGGKIVISPEIQLSYVNRATLRGIWQQSFNNGLWNPYTVWLTGGSLHLRHFIPLAFVCGIVALSVGALFRGGVFGIVFLGYLALYSICAFVAARKQEPKKNLSNTPLVMIAFISLHLSYGLGSLWGLLTTPFRFPRRYLSAVGKPLADRKH